MNRLTQLLIAASLQSLAVAQISFTYGPEEAPIGCPVHVTINNDTGSPLLWDPCGMSVVDANGSPVYIVPCNGPVGIPPGGTFVHTWPQLDSQGAQVPPGNYHFVNTAGPLIQVGGVDMAISQLGAAAVGTARSFQLSSPLDPGAPFVVIASGSSSPGIPTCGGFLPLQRDRLMRLSLRSPAVFRGFRGNLDAAGLAVTPTLVIPDDPALIGTDIVLAFIVLNQGAACRFERISPPLEFMIH